MIYSKRLNNSGKTGYAGKHSQAKKRITELKKEARTGFFVAPDGVIRHWNGTKRYIITGIDTRSKIAFARMYTSNDEFIEMGNMSADCEIFNKRLTDWLIEYNFKRPHQALAYEVPVEYYYKNKKVSPLGVNYTNS